MNMLTNMARFLNLVWFQKVILVSKKVGNICF